MPPRINLPAVPPTDAESAPPRAPLVPERSDFLEGDTPAAAKVQAFRVPPKLLQEYPLRMVLRFRPFEASETSFRGRMKWRNAAQVSSTRWACWRGLPGRCSSQGE
jgi:hypothetical protein